jgi:outer membrane receptor protein involved in Fe transport
MPPCTGITPLNQAVFVQAEGSLPADIKATLGVRFERYVLDGAADYSNPVFRAGLNWKILEHTFLRASIGQGYRFPSVAEKYTATNVGALRIFPNPGLVSETGWSSEVGLKQGLKIGNWQGYLDLSAFLSEYHHMIEFVFDIYGNDTLPTINDYGFMAQNVGKARISGIETTIYGSGSLGDFNLSLLAGYTFMHPYDPDSGEILKYRYRHSLKSDAELDYGHFGLGYTLVVNSRMERVDEVFTDPLFGNLILPGFPDYWKGHNSTYAVLDVRVLCNITKFLRAAVVVKNIMDKEYMGRPGDIQPPRNITLRLTAEF